MNKVLSKIFPIILISFFAFSSIFPQKLEIKSLKAFAADNEASLPVITPQRENNRYLSIEFDVAAPYEPNLVIVFRFCDRDWKPYQNLFLLNQGKNIAYNLSYASLPATVKEANYNYYGTFPDRNDYVDFPFSGKWRFYITDSQDTTKVYASGKFVVILDDIKISTSLKREQLEDKTYFPADMAKVYNITSEFNLPQKMFPTFVDHLEIIENQKFDYPVIVDKNFNTNQRQFYWNGDRKFTFTARDIRPGNEYRETDTRNINKFNSENVRAQFDGLEYSRFFKEEPRDLNGGSKLTFYKNDFATYLNVDFSIRPPGDVTGNIFLVGAFNNWQILPEYEMENNYGVYKISVQLKRGIYDYQYVTADLINGKIKNPDWYILEGNSWETVNDYHVFLYYNDPDKGGYDRIIGYNRILSK